MGWAGIYVCWAGQGRGGLGQAGDSGAGWNITCICSAKVGEGRSPEEMKGMSGLLGWEGE